MNELAKVDQNILASLIIQGDISKLDANQRVEYITKLCDRVGVDPLTQPFKILRLQGKEVLYADKGCAQQLCKVYDISTEITKKERIEDVYVVTTRAKMPNGRYTDEDGAVPIANLKGEQLSNALMKANTKSKRRAVLALCGLGMLDESEIDSIPNAKASQEPLEMPKKKAQEPIKAEDKPKATEAEVKEQSPVKSDLSAKSVASLNAAKKSCGKFFDQAMEECGVTAIEQITTNAKAKEVFERAKWLAENVLEKK